MAEEQQGKTEDATPHKLQQARDKGIVARGMDLGVFANCSSAALYLWISGAGLAVAVATNARRILMSLPNVTSSADAFSQFTLTSAEQTIGLVLPLFLCVFAVVLLFAVLQTRHVFAPAALKPDFSRLNPAQGAKKFLSLQALIESLRSVLKLAVYSTICLVFISKMAVIAVRTPVSAQTLSKSLQHSALHLLFYLLTAALFFVLIDQVLSRRRFSTQMRMSPHEVKDEFRQREGDPRIKQRRRQLQAELLKRTKSMKGVRGADVLVTNPTHYAIALRYDPKTMSAPTIVSKGAGDFAMRLKALAFLYGVMVIEDKLLARKLFLKGQLEKEIPAHAYDGASRIYLALQKRKHVSPASH